LAKGLRNGAALSGPVLASVLWKVAKQLFRFHIRQAGLYDQIYRPLRPLGVFVMSLYCSAIVFGTAWVAALDSRQP
jgi:uncharacterized BrkB/YihY/UPF0761 family membrane protein